VAHLARDLNGILKGHWAILSAALIHNGDYRRL
jgi:hypothetical protein